MKTKIEPDLPAPTTIKAYTCELLCEVVYFESRFEDPGPDNRVGPGHPDRRSVGYSYSDIARMVKLKFPDAKISSVSVRRVNGRIRAEEPGFEGYLLPGRRPRATSK